MKPNRTYLFIAISSFALMIVLIIQVNWILKTAQVKKEIFDEKANMVLSRTTEALNANPEACRKIGESVQLSSETGLPAQLGNNEVRVIDSLFKHYMKFYNFHIDYSFEVIKPGYATAGGGNMFSNYIYNSPRESTGRESGFQLKLIFPEKKQFIIAEMGTMFITSVLLIIVVLIMFWRTTLSLLREKQISEHTNDFLNNMTHEFKTPLTNIALAGKMILKDSSNNSGDKIKHYSGIILEENEKLRLQVEQVLSMTALERGEIPLQKGDLNVHDLINDALKHLHLQIENAQGDLQLILTAEKQMIVGDHMHLLNAISNLIDNAIKYSKNKPEIIIKTVNYNNNLVISISDKGIGIEKEFQDKVFDKYFRVPTGDVHNVKGFGLGLAYIKKIIELHQGTITLRSESQKGTTFTLTFPHAR